MNKHTPGPWRIAPNGNVYYGEAAVFSSHVVATNADFNLIAAAPDLLAMCEELAARHERATGNARIEMRDAENLQRRREQHALAALAQEHEPIRLTFDQALWQQRLLDVTTRLRAENERLREACTLALNIMEQKNRVNVPPFAKFITVEFAPDDVAVLRAALEKKP